MRIPSSSMFPFLFLASLACGEPYQAPPVQLTSPEDMTSAPGTDVVEVPTDDMGPQAPDMGQVSEDMTRPPEDMVEPPVEDMGPNPPDMEQMPPDMTPPSTAPRIIDFSTNVQVATQENMIRFTAIVTDPDGIDDLIGGSLRNPTGGTYGAFATSSAEGSYQLNLTWDDLGAVEPIEFTNAAGIRRSFVAVFFDQAGNKTEATLELRITCANADELACEPNRCVDTNKDVDHCGACGQGLPRTSNPNDPSPTTCQQGEPFCEDDYPWCPNQQLCPDAYQDDACGDGCLDCAVAFQQAFPQFTLKTNSRITQNEGEVECSNQGRGRCEAVLKPSSNTTCDAACGAWRCTDASGYYRRSATSYAVDPGDCDETFSSTKNGEPLAGVRCECETR